MSDDTVIEESAIEVIRRVGGEALLHQMIDLFLEHAPRRLDAIRSANETGDARALHHAAHSMKSSAGTFGATSLALLAGQVERRAADGKLEGIGDLVARIGPQLAEVSQRLVGLQTATPPAP